MKRILFIAVATVVAIAAFAFLTSGSSADTHGHDESAEAQNEKDGAHDEAADFDDIPLTQKQISTIDLRMGQMSRRQIDATLRASGQLVLRAQNQASVAALMGGVVKSILVKEGQTVSRGQTLATIENTDVVALQREYYSALKEAQLAQTETARQKTLQQNGAGVKKTLQQAESAWRIAQANTTGIARQLQQMGISPAAVAKGHFTTVFPVKAPIGGTVSQLTASLGSYADMQTPLMRIRDNRAVEADLSVFEKDLARVKPGDRVVLTLTNQQGRKLAGRIYAINQYFNDGTKAVSAHVRLDNAGDARLFDGMYVEGQIATGTQTCDALPSEAIVRADGKNYVFLLNAEPKDGRYSFSRHEVQTGAEQDGYTEVQPCEHIKKNTKIVTDNAFYLASLTGEHGEHNH